MLPFCSSTKKFSTLKLIIQDNLGLVPLPLLHEWKKRTGIDPITHARARVQVWISSIIGTTFFTAMIIAYALHGPSASGWEDEVENAAKALFLAGMVGIMGGMLYLALVMMLCFPPGAYWKHKHAGFERAWPQFLERTGRDPEDFRTSNLSDFRKLGVEMIIDIAGELEDKKIVMADFDRWHQLLMSLGVVDGNKPHFLAQGRKKARANDKAQRGNLASGAIVGLALEEARAESTEA